MNDHSLGLRRSKRLQIKSIHLQIKPQRLSACERTAATKIIDLNDDCLEKIFGDLDLSSLFNVAVSNEWLRPAARSVYGRRFGRHKVVFEFYFISSALATEPFPHAIYVQNLKTSLQFLRCFGPWITSLEICFYRSYCKGAVYLQQYVNEYCAESLVEVKYRNIPSFSTKNFQKPFTNVESVEIYNVDLGNQLQFFVKWFPNLHRLWLLEVSVGSRFVATNFPHLEHLRTEIGKRDKTTDGFSKKDVADLLRLNPQLQSLDVKMLHFQRTRFTSLLNIASDNLGISRLMISTGPRTARANATELIEFAKARPSLTEIYFRYFRFSVDDVVAIIRQLKSLKWFCFRLGNRTEYNNLMGQLDNQWLSTHISYFGSQFLEIQLKRRN